MFDADSFFAGVLDDAGFTLALMKALDHLQDVVSCAANQPMSHSDRIEIIKIAEKELSDLKKAITLKYKK